MAKRFLDTNFYKSPFVRALPAHLKSFYVFVITDCSHSGIWIKDFEAVKLYAGIEVTDKDFDEYFIKSEKAFLLKPGVYFFPDFIEHQYPSGLSESNKAHKGSIAELKKYNIDTLTLKPLGSPLEGSKATATDKVMVKVKESPINPDDPLQYYRDRFNKMSADQLWVDGVLKSYSINALQLKQHLTNFFVVQAGDHKVWKDQSDCNRHFRFWLQNQPVINIEVTDAEILKKQKAELDEWHDAKRRPIDRIGLPKKKSTDAFVIEGEEGDDE